jgi:hypothetical protein
MASRLLHSYTLLIMNIRLFFHCTAVLVILLNQHIRAKQKCEVTHKLVPSFILRRFNRMYRGADKSLSQLERKQATATEEF